MYALDCGSYDDIMSWTPSGLAFVIIDPVSFEKKVLPELFKEAKFASFDRKVSEISKSFIIVYQIQKCILIYMCVIPGVLLADQALGFCESKTQQRYEVLLLWSFQLSEGGL